MNWLFPAQIFAMMGTLLLVFIHLYLWGTEKEKHLLIWILSWIFYLFRFICELGLSQFVNSQPLWLSLVQLFSFGSGLILVWGTCIFSGKDFPKIFIWLFFPAVIWTVLGKFLNLNFMIASLPGFLYFGSLFIFSGVLILQNREILKSEKNLVGILFIISGIHKLDYPFLRPVDWLAAPGFIFGVTLQMMIGLSLILMYINREKTRAQSEKTKIEALFTHAPMGIVLIDYNSSGKIEKIRVNQYLQNLLGYSEKELLEKTFMGVTHPEDLENEKLLRDQLTDGDFNAITLQKRYLSKNQDTIWAEVTVWRLKNKDLPGSAMGLISNITEKRRMQEKLKEEKERAETANQAKSVFLSNMSHELRTPLNGIVGIIGLLQETSLLPDQQNYLVMLETCSESLTRIVNDLLDLASIEAGKVVLHEQPVKVSELFEELEHIFYFKAKQKFLTLSWENKSDQENFICDAGKLKHILMNLIGNALKFTDQGGVCISAELLKKTDGQFMAFQVQDTGIGIAPAQGDSIFEPFVQGDLSYTKKYQGAGLGLSISNRLTQILKGRLSYQSIPGQGSVFTLLIPYQKI